MEEVLVGTAFVRTLARAEVERLQEDAKRLQAEEAAKRQLARCATHRQTSLKLSRLRDTPTDF
jgi:hypothetical protein